MKITSQKDVWVVALMINIFAAVVVVSAIIYLYPPESWKYEISLSLSLTFIIATPVSLVMAQQIKKNNQLAEELQRLVNRDRLTDVGTRDYFFNRMEEAPDAFGVSLMVDIDNFKSINDTHGHFVGDAVIKQVATILKSAVRKEDLIARFGGEEFIVFLSDHDSHSGFEVAERMRKQIAEEVVKFSGVNVNITVSIGGSLKDATDKLETSIQEADRVLYQAKENGRNQTIFAKKKNFQNAFGAKAAGITA